MRVSLQCAIALFTQLSLSGTATIKASEITGPTSDVTVEEPVIAQARKHPSYQVFVFKSQLPEVRCLERGVLAVGPRLKINLRSLNKATLADQQELIRLLQMPQGCLLALAQRLSTNQVEGEILAAQFRTAVNDYRYLAEKWREYRPATDRVATKTEGLGYLEHGEIDRAWKLFLSLPRPEAPRGLHITGTQRN